MFEDLSVSKVKGVGKKTEEALQNLGVYSVGDMLSYFPRDYVELPEPGFSPEKEGKLVSLMLRVDAMPVTRRGRRMDVTVTTGRSEGQTFELIWFRMPYVRSLVKAGETYVFYGRLVQKPSGYALEQPKIFQLRDYEERRKRLIPVYAASSEIKSTKIEKLVRTILSDPAFALMDNLPAELQKRQGLISRLLAIEGIHQAKSREALIEARKRLVFEEFFFFLLTMESVKEKQDKEKNRFPAFRDDFVEGLIKKLPFSLTDAQTNALSEMKQDIAGPHLMHRLLQGDVGSGKTILAFLLMAEMAHNGLQSALMAPTEVLASQHYETFQRLEEELSLDFPVILLTGRMTAAEKREGRKRIAEEKGAMVIGTHALFQDAVEFHSLSLVITDEQHRFGVRQREALSEKGERPHILVMSATPIPRTLAIILYGDLDISVIHELPKNRLPIKNAVVGPEWREKAYEFIEKEVAKGRQAMVICPLIEESEALSAENVTDYSALLKERFGKQIRVDCLHGRMDGALKTKKMEEFASGKTKVLVSTTVIEVGINVPNATVMMVENAERFGLAALHQLRGRVGRGAEQSYCIFVNTGDEEKNRRLEILKSSNDGFYIASEDLKLRGPGDFLGVRQSGDLGFVLADIYQDAELLKNASEEAKRILAADPELSSPENECIRQALDRKRDSFLENLNL
ncbi:MAG: ATP-dependent DNA helicase RecG [Lachnospiraceae bacterium]|nr:ATP-dependent DNA helicase RecG [Lachnospiraceae bacterium]